MNTISTTSYETLYDAFLDAKSHPMICDETTTIICASQDEMDELRGIAQNDEDHEGDALAEDSEGRDMVDIWGCSKHQIGDCEYRIYLQLA
jgi:hypothetical protein